jgi:hypothetical protein
MYCACLLECQSSTCIVGVCTWWHECQISTCIVHVCMITWVSVFMFSRCVYMIALLSIFHMYYGWVGVHECMGINFPHVFMVRVYECKSSKCTVSLCTWMDECQSSTCFEGMCTWLHYCAFHMCCLVCACMLESSMCILGMHLVWVFPMYFVCFHPLVWLTIHMEDSHLYMCTHRQYV